MLLLLLLLQPLEKKKIAIFDLWVCMKMSFVLRILIAYYSSMFSLKVLSTKNPCCCWKKFLVSKNVPCSFLHLVIIVILNKKVQISIFFKKPLLSSILIRISPKHEVGNSQPAWHFICSITKLNNYLFRKILIKYQKPQLLFFIWAPKSKSKQMTLWGHRWWEKKYMLHFKLRSIFFAH